MKRGFTLIELLVVIAMILLLTGSVSTALMGARNRAKIAKATATCQELTNAILAFENYQSLAKHLMADWQEATPDKVAFLVDGKTKTDDGATIPVLFNASYEKRGKNYGLLDPWGNYYRIKIARQTKKIETPGSTTLKTSVFFPNYNRRRAWERD